MTLSVANTILSQLGGNKFLAMTGSKNLLGSSDSLSFSVGRGAKNGINKARVTLTAADLYTVEFFRFAKYDLTPKGKTEGIYADQLQEVFTRHTGIDTRL